MNPLAALALDIIESDRNSEYLRSQSYRHYHSRRLDYLCLYRTEALTIKAYKITGAAGFLVAPHNHRYNFQTFVLDGAMANITFEEQPLGDQFGEPMNKYAYDCITGTFTAVKKLNLCSKWGPMLGEGMGYTLQHNEIHTIYVPVDSILLLFQHEDTPVKETALYTAGEPPNLAGLYQPWERGDFRRAVAEMKSRLMRGPSQTHRARLEGLG